MLLSLKRKIVLCLSAGLTTAILLGPAIDSGLSTGTAFDRFATEKRTCARLSPYATREFGFLSELHPSCKAALTDVRAEASPRLAFEAATYLHRLEDLEVILANLPSPPSDIGAYLIARETGALDALRQWNAIQIVRSSPTHQASLD